MRVTEVIDAWGHENIRSTHKTTFEITKETVLTRRGDCIIGVYATKGATDLHLKFRQVARKENTRITITVEADEMKEVIQAFGSPQLLFTHPTDLVIRKSDYVCGRTIAIRADKSAAEFSRKLVEKLQNPNQKVRITLVVES